MSQAKPCESTIDARSVLSGAEADSAAHTDPEYVTRDELRQRLNAIGVPITAGTMSQICAPARGEGPPIAGYWGRVAMYRLDEGLAWGRARIRPGPHKLHPVYGKRKAAGVV
jgi:hypothetical protein